MSLATFPVTVLMNDFFGENFVFWITCSNFGISVGALILPVVIERSLQAYGYHGAYLIMGGISLHAIAAGCAVRTLDAVENKQSSGSQDNSSFSKHPEDKTKQHCQLKLRGTLSKNGHGRILPSSEHNSDTTSGNSRKAEGKNQFQNSFVQSKARQAHVDIHSEDTDMADSVPQLSLSIYTVNVDSKNTICINGRIALETKSQNRKSETISTVAEISILEKTCNARSTSETCDARSTNKTWDARSTSDSCTMASSQSDNDEVPLLHEVGDYYGTNSEQKSGSKNIRISGYLSKLKSYTTSSVLFKEPVLVLMLPAVLLSTYVYFSWMLFLVPHAEWRHIPPSRAVLLSTFAGSVGLFGRIAFLIVDYNHYDMFIFLAACASVSAVVFFLDELGSSFWFLSVTAILQAVAIFGSDPIGLLVSKRVISDDTLFSSAASLGDVAIGLGGMLGQMLSGMYRHYI